MKRVRGALALLTLHVITLGAQGQPTFRAATRLVQVSVVVEDRDRQPIPGLTQADFRILDGGQEQRIEVFFADAGPGGTATRAAAPQPPVSAATSGAGQQFSNRLASPGSATVILFDRLNTPASDQLHARQQLIWFLGEIRPEDRIGIYVLEPDAIRVLHDFTNDASSLVRAITRYRAMTSNEAAEMPDLGSPDTGSAALDAQIAAFLERAEASMAEHFMASRGDATTAAFEAIANHLAAIEGRKNLIWVTGGLPLQAFAVRGANMSTGIQRAIRPLNDANVTLYAVDARGLVAAMTYGPNGKPAFTTMSSVQTAGQDILQIASAETGGRAFVNTNDINRAVRRAVDDSRVTYTLGYYPAHGKWDGAYRPITVRVNRPGVQVRHRKGYLAVSPRPVVAGAGIRSALSSPLEATGVELTARIERVAGTERDVQVVVTMAPGSVAFAPAGENWEGTLDIVVAQTVADGSTTRSVDRTANLTLTRDRYDTARQKGFSIDTRLTVQPGAQSLHVVVHDHATGKTGSIVVPADRLQAVLRAP